MNRVRIILLIAGLVIQCQFIYCQSNSATLRGTIKDLDGNVLDLVNIGLKDYPIGTSSNRDGNFLLRIPAQKKIIIVFSFIGFNSIADTITAKTEEILYCNVIMSPADNKLDEVTVSQEKRDRSNITRIDPKFINLVPNASGGFEAILKTLPGVSSNNELSSQYSVRGGNYDENLVYVNDIEVYRPFLIRAGQQEGLSFINSDLVSTIDFSAGGFNAKYNDKISSVLDIKYRKPSDFRGSASVSALGATVHFEDIALKGKLSHISGIRYKSNRYLLGSLDEKGEYNPDFFDYQTYITYQFTEKSSISFLGNLAQNKYRFIPETRQTTFGTWQAPLNAKIYFEGQEVDDLRTFTGALSWNYNPNTNVSLKLIASAYKAKEKETYDVLGQYFLNELEKDFDSENFGDSIMNIGIGSFLNHARNNLEALVWNFSHRGAYNSEQHLINWGIKFQHEQINNRINEWTYRDSAFYSLPYSDNKINLFYTLRNNNNLNSNRITGFIQNTYNIPVSNGDLYMTGGLRFNFWDFNNELLISPRATILFFPEWKKRISFRFSAGMYYQSPFFKELINRDGTFSVKLTA